MRARNIKPGFWESERIGKLTDTQRVLYIGLWCIADRDGKLPDRPEKIRHLLFGYASTPPDINGELTVLERCGFIHRYKVGLNQYIIIRTFKEHQSPHHTERKSEIPDPVRLSIDHGEFTVNSPFRHGENPPDSPNYDSLNYESPLTPTKVGEERRNAVNGLEATFAAFWASYPRKVGKGAAFRVWRRLAPTVELRATIQRAIEIQKKGDDWRKEGGRYIPNPATWLNQERWLDEVRPAFFVTAVDPRAEEEQRRKRREREAELEKERLLFVAERAEQRKKEAMR